MSMHRKPLTDLERTGLKAHGLDIGKPSQLSDAFRQGVAWAEAHYRARIAELEARQVPEPTSEDMAWLRRFEEICEDGDADGHDLPKTALKSLEKLGALRSCSFGRHETTLFGEYLLAHGHRLPTAER